MKPFILLAAAFTLSAGLASAQSLADNPPKTTIICPGRRGPERAGQLPDPGEPPGRAGRISACAPARPSA